MQIAHLVEPMGGASHLWGKEEVIRQLMTEQRRLYTNDPILLSFSEGHLCDTMRDLGFRVEIIPRKAKTPLWNQTRDFTELCLALKVDAVHSHGYKSNILSRLAKTLSKNFPALVSTSHGFDYYSKRLRIYNWLDVMSAAVSDRVTITAPCMREDFPAYAKPIFVANGLAVCPKSDPLHRIEERKKLGLQDRQIAVGTLSRMYPHKGLSDFLKLAEKSASQFGDQVQFFIAGAGPMADEIAAAAKNFSNVLFLGYVEDADLYLGVLDLFVQMSYREGLSIALLQAMRMGLPILATDVGATSDVIEHGKNGFIFPPGDVLKASSYLQLVFEQPEIIRKFGTASREIFLTDYTIVQQCSRFNELYRDALQHKAIG